VGEFLVEFYVARTDDAAVARCSQGAREAAEAFAREGTRIRYVRSLFVPEDETCFCIYEADSADAVLAAARRAGLPADHITELFTHEPSTPPVAPVAGTSA
jgi:hypothetical protein